eukprot:164146-Chlamydomonas_euryale.AAC.1
MRGSSAMRRGRDGAAPHPHTGAGAAPHPHTSDGAAPHPHTRLRCHCRCPRCLRARVSSGVTRIFAASCTTTRRCEEVASQTNPRCPSPAHPTPPTHTHRPLLAATGSRAGVERHAPCAAL